MDGETLTVWQQIEGSSIAAFVRETTWTYPILENLHIIGIALIFGSILAFDLRVLGFNRALPIVALGRHLLPWVWTGFLVNATTGTLLFASDAVEFSENPALAAKLGLIVLAGVNALVFQWRIMPNLSTLDGSATPPILARISAIASIGLWLSIITAGRLMAYIK